MSLSDHETRQLHELCEAMVEQTITDEQAQYLAAWLKTSEEARRLYVRFLGMSASLHHYAGLTQLEPVTPAAVRPASSPSRSWLAILTVAACLLLSLGAAVWFIWRPGSSDDRPVVEAIVGTAEVESGGTIRPLDGPAPLAVGDRVRVPATALAVLRYADGSLVELRSDTVVQLRAGQADEAHAKVLMLEQGTLFAEVQPQRSPMIVLTPNARARVLGTRFLLTASTDETRLDVQRGKVQFAPLQDHQAVDVLGGHVAVATTANAVPSLQITRAAAGGENLVENPGFELPLQRGKAPHWGRQQTAVLDNAVAHTGMNSLKVTGPAAFNYVWQSIALEPDTSYRLSVWIKTDNVTGKDGVRARYAQIEPRTIVWRSAAIRGTTDWVQWRTEFRTPADYCCGRLDLTWELNDGEIAWFDDVELIKIDPAPTAKR